ncbi:hypothetical protein HN958_02570 [Candidatus Falkowbacteria bacterium]|nr:hypothetical protein [Candidatus Falkowbacteria bacterium]
MLKPGARIAIGKTKTIYTVEEHPDLCWIENRDDITADDDPSKTREIEGKALFATTVTCNVFALLKKLGIAVAFRVQTDDTSFVAKRCRMIPIEVVVRRFAVGSYLKRSPELVVEEGAPPHRFEDVVVELFLKTTRGELIVNDETVVSGLNPGKGEEDPLMIYNPREYGRYYLYHPKRPVTPESSLNRSLSVDQLGVKLVNIENIQEISRRVFLLLEKAWERLDCRLIDFKIEFGITADGELVVADVIDNDSWRLRDQDWNELSKQVFRDGAGLDEVSTVYELVAELSRKFQAMQISLP